MNTETLCERVLELDELGTDGPWSEKDGNIVDADDQDILFIDWEETNYGGSYIDGNTEDYELIAEYRSAAPILAKEVLKLREALELIELGKLDCDPVLIAREALGEE